MKSNVDMHLASWRPGIGERGKRAPGDSEVNPDSWTGNKSFQPNMF